MLNFAKKVFVFININRKIIIPHVLDSTSVEDFKEIMAFQLKLEESSENKTTRNVEAINHSNTILDLIQKYNGNFTKFYIAENHDTIIVEVVFSTPMDMIYFVECANMYSGITARYTITTAFKGKNDLDLAKRNKKYPKRLSRIYAKAAYSDGADTELYLNLATFFMALKNGVVYDIRQFNNQVLIDVNFKTYADFCSSDKELHSFFA